MSWPQWQGTVQPNVAPLPVVNPAPAAVPMGLQYTPEQWQQMQQQNWQQWAQWQQQYQQWHQQYGAEYQKTLNAMAGAAAAPVPPMPMTSLPPPLPQETKPPLPPDEPPVQVQPQKPQNYQGYSTVPTQPPPNFASVPPPDPNNFNNVPKPQNLQWKTQTNIPPPNITNTIVKKPDLPKQEFGNKRPFTGNQPVAPDVKRNKFEQNWQDPASNPPPNQAEELSDPEKKFMKQFAEWEAQFNKWKEQNQDHPDKTQYKEYEKKWEAWRNQLLERREQMRRKRLGLTAAQDPKPVPKPSGAPPVLPAKPSTSDVLLKDKPRNDDALGGRDAPFFTENLRNEPPPFFEQPPPNVQDAPLQFKDRQSGYKTFNENSNDNSSFFKSNPSGGIPGLDLVDETEKTEDDTSLKGENTDSAKAEQNKIPDLDALSKNINSILGDQKLLSILNLVSQKQKPNEVDVKASETASIANEVSRSSFNEDADSKSQFALSIKSDGYDRRADDVKPWEETNERNGRNFAENWGGGRDENQGQFNRNGPGQFNRPGNFNPPLGNRPENIHDNMDMPDRFNVPPPGNRFDGEVGGRFNNRGPGNGPDFEAPRQRFPYNNRTNDQNFNNYPRGDNFGRDSFNRRDGGFNRPPPRVDNRWPNEERHNNFNRDNEGDMYSENIHGGGMDEEPQGNFNAFNNRPDNFNRRGPNEQNFNNFNRNNSRGDNFNRNNRRMDHYNEQGDGEFDEDMRNYGRDGPEGFGDYDNEDGNNYDENNYDENNYDGNNYDQQEPYEEEGNWEAENNWPQEESFPAESEVPNEADEAPPASEEILIIENVTDYNHKPKKTATFEVTVVPPHLFDYRHKTVNRIPLPERPKWLSETFRSIPEFEPSIGRPPIPYNRYQQPIQRFDYRSGPKQLRYNDHNSYNRRQGNNRRYEERRPNDECYEPEYKKGRDDRFKKEENYEPEYNKGREDRFKKEECYEPEYNKGRDDRYKKEESYEPEYNKGREDRFKKEDNYEPQYNKGRDDRYKSNYDRGYEDRFNERGGRQDRFNNPDYESRNEKVRERSPKVDFEHNRRSREPVKNVETFPIKQQSKPSNKPCNTVMIDDILKPPGRFKRPPRIVIILRGPPGSGKTFLAKLIKDKEVESGGSAPRILSLDDYFMVEQEKEVTEDGKKVKIKEMVYEYEECMEGSYRTSLLKSFKKTITDGYFPFIIVDNVNDKIKYFNEMWSFAKQNGFEVYVCQLELDIQICTKRNEHGRSESDIKNIVSGWETTPSHYAMLDATNLIQDGSIAEVEMEEINSPNENFDDDEEIQEQAYSSSKWDNFECSIDNLAKLDGINKPLRSTGTMEDYLQMDEWKPKEAKPGQKRVRWADLEEQKEQEKMRAIGFVVGQTDWDRMMDPTQGGSALTKTKYIERVHNY